MIDLDRKFPIGIQTFEKLREGGYLYVDKTALLWKIAYFVFSESSSSIW